VTFVTFCVNGFSPRTILAFVIGLVFVTVSRVGGNNKDRSVIRGLLMTAQVADIFDQKPPRANRVPVCCYLPTINRHKSKLTSSPREKASKVDVGRKLRTHLGRLANLRGGGEMKLDSSMVADPNLLCPGFKVESDLLGDLFGGI
jgi:hypothetical protein